MPCFVCNGGAREQVSAVVEAVGEDGLALAHKLRGLGDTELTVPELSALAPLPPPCLRGLEAAVGPAPATQHKSNQLKPGGKVCVLSSILKSNQTLVTPNH